MFLLVVVLASVLVVLGAALFVCILMMSRRANEVAMSVANLPIVVREQTKSAFAAMLAKSNAVRVYSLVLDGSSMRLIRQRRELYAALGSLLDLSTVGTHLISVQSGKINDGASVAPYYCHDKVEFVVTKKTSDDRAFSDAVAANAVRHVVVGNCVFTVLTFVEPPSSIQQATTLLPLGDSSVYALIKYDADSYFCDGDSSSSGYVVPRSALADRSAQDRIGGVVDLLVGADQSNNVLVSVMAT